MGGNQHIRTVEYIQQAVHFIHQHITGTGAHEQLDAANAVFVQLVKFCIVVVGCSEVAGMVDDTLLIQQVEFGIQGIQRYGQRIGIGHVHNGSHPPAAAARLSVRISALWVRPGSRNAHGRR